METDNLEQLSNTEHAKEWLDKIREENIPYDPLVTYFFINKNLKMSSGKIGVQTARAGQVMLLNELNKGDTLLLDSLGELTSQDFMKGNKSIALRANENQLKRILFGDFSETLKELSTEHNIPIRTYPVFDIGATEVDVNSLTVVVMTPVKQSIINKFIRKFHVY